METQEVRGLASGGESCRSTVHRAKSIAIGNDAAGSSRDGRERPALFTRYAMPKPTKHLFVGGPLDGMRLGILGFASVWSRVNRSEIILDARDGRDVLQVGTYWRFSVPARLLDAQNAGTLRQSFYRHHTLSEAEAVSMLITNYPSREVSRA